MSVVVRPLAAGDDVAVAGQIVQQAYFGLDGYPHDPQYDQMLGDVVARSHDALIVIALLDEEVVGCLTYVPDRSSPHHEFDDEEAASFRYFGVDPSVQGRGVGEAMVQWCIDTARRAGRRRLRIHTLESMPAAQRLYERMAFERDPGFDEDWDGIIGLSYVFHT